MKESTGSKEDIIKELNNLRSRISQLENSSDTCKPDTDINTSDEEKHRMLLQNAYDVIWLWDIKQNRYLYVSPSVENLRKYTIKEIMAQSLTDALLPESLWFITDELPLRIKQMESGHESARIKSYELEQKCKDGSSVSTEVMTTFLTDPDGKVTHIHGITRNINERKRIEKILRQNEEKYRIISDFASNWEYWLGPEEQIIYMSPSSVKITGYGSDEFISNPELLIKIVHPDDHEFFQKHIFEYKDKLNKDNSEIEFRIITRAGDTVWLEHKCQAIFLSDGSYGGRRVSNSDITRRKNAEEKYHSMFLNNYATLLIIDPESGNITDANPAACRYYGYDYNTLITLKITDLNILSRDQVFDEMEKARSEKRYHFYFSHRMADGEIRPVEVYSGPISVKGKNMLFSIIHDISERRKAENEKEKLILELKDALSKIKKLSGMLPICASCKKIRDDKGYWKQIETYIAEHSEADFSHSICPDCMKKLYPGYNIE